MVVTDSILFPEVPIALRLSSHLLLGVVRIYSRKVNYLFDDCSEALLKIKQAFRSTAVDLPPEESTAPYHSITLPETFDLDDFELPDSDILQALVLKYLNILSFLALAIVYYNGIFSVTSQIFSLHFQTTDTNLVIMPEFFSCLLFIWLCFY
ncbi:hypothetical protein V8G54_021637 [Vigna mungo]|uniref:Rad21/Rec8-like protein N-terminal domain-containing protein n=1 Tax=Vigna mungo TaxID=3915 RepID=A0AAQ3NEI9_VIGMU